MLPYQVATAGINLSPLQLRAALRQLGYTHPPPPEAVFAPEDCLGLWLLLLLEKLQFLSPEQRSFLFEEMVGNLQQMAGELVSKHGEDRPTPLLVFADGRYATWHEYAGWLDLSTGEQTQALARPPLETVGYNLAVMFDRNLAACRERHREAP